MEQRYERVRERVRAGRAAEREARIGQVHVGQRVVHVKARTERHEGEEAGGERPEADAGEPADEAGRAEEKRGGAEVENGPERARGRHEPRGRDEAGEIARAD